MFEIVDLFWLLAGFGFFGMTMMRLFSLPHLPSIPMIYVIVGAVLASTSMAVLLPDPQASALQLAVVKYASEVIVIVAIAGAGLALDRPCTLAGWRHTWLLLLVVMPLTMTGLVWMGMAFAGLPLASAVLLAAVLSPTDPVLARSVQVEGPNEDDEHDVQVALTAEAGLNDGLAFPFVYLALALVALPEVNRIDPRAEWFTTWLTFDFSYRVAAGLFLGWLVGRTMGMVVHSKYGDAQCEAKNAGMVMLATTFIAYGLAESVQGYGFLAVFIAARAARNHSSRTGAARYIEHPHQFSDQFEKAILALFLFWLGGYAVGAGLDGLKGAEILVAALLIFVLRPLAGMLALLPLKGPLMERFAIGAFGIRGLGTLFYIAYAAGEASFEGMDAIWRISIVAILLSVFVHGILAPLTMGRIESRENASRE